MEFEIIRYAVTQGGLVLVCLAVFWFYRRDFLSKQEQDKSDKEILLDALNKNTRAHMRLVSALDRRGYVADRRGSGDDDGM